MSTNSIGSTIRYNISTIPLYILFHYDYEQ